MHYPQKKSRDIRYWIDVFQLLFLNSALRIGDVFALLSAPRTLYSYLRIIWRGVIDSPYKWPSSFDSVRRRNAAGQTLNELVYGEVPITSALKIFRRLPNFRACRFIDLMAGRGRVCIAARFAGAQTSGIDIVDTHTKNVAELMHSLEIEFLLGDGATHPLSKYDVVFMTLTGASKKTIARFVDNLVNLRSSSLIISVDRALSASYLELTEQLNVYSTWGVVPVYIYKKNDLSHNF